MRQFLRIALLTMVLGAACHSQSLMKVSSQQATTSSYPTNSKVPVLFGWWMDTLGTTIDQKNAITRISDGICLFYKVQISTDAAFNNIIYRDTLIQDNYNYRIYPSFAKRYAMPDSLIPRRTIPDTTFYTLKPLMVAGVPDSAWSTKRNIDLYFRVNARWVQWSFWPNGREWWIEWDGLESAYTPGMRFKLGPVLTIGDPVQITAFILGNNYPNPINPTTNIPYHIPETAWVEIAVYDLLGREIDVLVNAQRDVGDYEVTWNATRVPSGVYICRMRGISTTYRQFANAKKITVLR